MQKELQHPLEKLREPSTEHPFGVQPLEATEERLLTIGTNQEISPESHDHEFALKDDVLSGLRQRRT